MPKVTLPEQMMDRPVLVIGAAGLDMVGSLRESQRIERPNPANIRVSYGGVARNVAENLARLGQPVRLITSVGKDHMGSQLLEYTRSSGVEVSACLQVENYATASYLAVYNAQGEREVTLDDMRVLHAITPAYLRKQRVLFSEASIVFVDANLSPAAMKTVFQMARQARVPVCADATSSGLADAFFPYLEDIYMLTANSEEASVFSQSNPEVTGRSTGMQVVRQIVNLGAEIAVVSLAEFGVCYATSETSGHVPAVRTKILDPTGAGDALTATTLFGFLNEIPIDEFHPSGCNRSFTDPAFPWHSVTHAFIGKVV